MIEFVAQGQVCQLIGELSTEDVSRLWPKRQTLLAPEVTVLELSQLHYSDSAGIAFILALWQQHQQAGRTLALRAPSPQVGKLIALYDLQACFEKAEG